MLVDPPMLLRGVLLGFSIAAPVGPIGVLCIRRTLADGRTAGFVSGLGAATADALYGCVAAFGITVVSNALLQWRAWMAWAGGLFLVWLGWRTFLARPPKWDGAPSTSRPSPRWGAWGSTFLLTVTNPMTILSFAAVFAGLGLGSIARGFAPAASLVAGVFLGSALWWLSLSGGVSLLRSRFTASGLLWVNRISGAVLVAFGVAALALGGASGR